ncbi:MAG: hypothetical protein PHF84_02985, partial [bacterium]|nr:hypothetical protein [bacterium]
MKKKQSITMSPALSRTSIIKSFLHQNFSQRGYYVTLTFIGLCLILVFMLVRSCTIRSRADLEQQLATYRQLLKQNPDNYLAHLGL